jgi:hypothetical protein
MKAAATKPANNPGSPRLFDPVYINVSLKNGK